jgi:phage shock protein A
MSTDTTVTATTVSTADIAGQLDNLSTRMDVMCARLDRSIERLDQAIATLESARDQIMATHRNLAGVQGTATMDADGC